MNATPNYQTPVKCFENSVIFTIKRFNHFCVKQKMNQLIKTDIIKFNPLISPL
jgi:hypothetical protein